MVRLAQERVVRAILRLPRSRPIRAVRLERSSASKSFDVFSLETLEKGSLWVSIALPIAGTAIHHVELVFGSWQKPGACFAAAACWQSEPQIEQRAVSMDAVTESIDGYGL